MFINKLIQYLFSQRGEGEEDTGAGQGAEGSAAVAEGQEGQGQEAQGQEAGQQGDQNASSKPQGQQGPTLEEIQAKYDELHQSFETFKGQAGATERNLAAERKALESMGMKVVRDSEGNVSVVPIAKSEQQSRFTDDHKSKFYTYFPDQQSGDGFLNIMNAYVQDMLETHISQYDKTLSQRQSFAATRQEAINKMFELYPSLNEKADTFNKNFYDRTNLVYQEKYASLPNGDLIAANEVAVEMGISPAALAKAEKKGYEQAQTTRKVVGVVDSQGKASSGFRKLTFAEYSKLSADEKEEYNRKEVESRK